MTATVEPKRPVFYVSDRTAVTAEALGQSLLSQFPGVEFDPHTIPFITNPGDAELAADRIRIAGRTAGCQPIVFCSITDEPCKAIITRSSDIVLDFLGAFIGPLEQALGVESTHTTGHIQGMQNQAAYERRMTALNFTLNHDDGLSPKTFHEADVILVGVSRCGKTPTCVYMGMHYSLKAANYPLTEDDLDNPRLPEFFRAHRDKTYGLTINAEQLSKIRRQRRAEGRYCTLPQCRGEIASAEEMFRNERLPFLDTSHVSIEEIAATIVHDLNLV